jgi:hypothetical protein
VRAGSAGSNWSIFHQVKPLASTGPSTTCAFVLRRMAVTISAFVEGSSLTFKEFADTCIHPPIPILSVGGATTAVASGVVAGTVAVGSPKPVGVGTAAFTSTLGLGVAAGTLTPPTCGLVARNAPTPTV